MHSETRVLSTFATLTRGRSVVADYAEERVWNGGIKSAQSMERVSVPLVDDRSKFGRYFITSTEVLIKFEEKKLIVCLIEQWNETIC